MIKPLRCFNSEGAMTVLWDECRDRVSFRFFPLLYRKVTLVILRSVMEALFYRSALFVSIQLEKVIDDT